MITDNSVTYRNIKGTSEEGTMCEQWCVDITINNGYLNVYKCQMPALYLVSRNIMNIHDVPLCRQCLERSIGDIQ